MLALTSAAAVFVVLLLAVAWLLWRGRDVPVWLTCVTTLLLAAFTLVCVVLLMLPLLRLLEMARHDVDAHLLVKTIKKGGNTMKSWENLEADENLILATHMTRGRQGCKVDKIVLHHNGGNLTGKGCYDVWQTREASAHYQVAADGRITQLVWDTDTAWHSGDWNANLTSIGVEHADISADPWMLSEATLDNGAHLVAALCKHYGPRTPAVARQRVPALRLHIHRLPRIHRRKPERGLHGQGAGWV